jgi:DNA-directed RNA polymerase subunit RPC12/RpoP
MNYRYIYKCEKCGRDYIEHRPETQEQIHTTCECSGTFVLDSSDQWGITEIETINNPIHQSYTEENDALINEQTI